MNRTISIALSVVAFVAVVSVGAFFYLTRDIAAPTTDISESVEEVEITSTDGSSTVFEIDTTSTTAEYNIYELLNGSDKTVVGMTDQVAGQIAINVSDLSQSEIGDLKINARTFATDDDRRDNAVARYILQSESDANEFIVFEPTKITGLSGSASVGDTVEFQVTGDLTVAGVTQTVTFNVSATLASEDQLTGLAETVISRADFNLSIPEVPMVANVGDEVTLKLDFTASAV
jgi:polyisoprenoid-binding protein YceI